VTIPLPGIPTPPDEAPRLPAATPASADAATPAAADAAAKAPAGDDADLRSAFDALGEPIVVTSAIRHATGAIIDFEVRWANLPWRRAVASVTGHPGDAIEDPVGRRLLELLPLVAERMDLARRVVDQRTSETVEQAIGDRWEELRYAPHGDGFVMIARDVTARVEAERNIGAARAQAELLVSLSPDAIIVHENGIVRFANQAAATLVGAAEPEVVLGRPAFDFVHPSSRPLAAARVRTMLETGAPSPRVAETFVRLDGSTVEVEVAAAPLPDRDDRTTILVIANDVSERASNAQAMAKANERLERAQRAAGVGFWDWDMTIEQLSWSRELFRIFGLDPDVDEATFDTWRRVLHPDDVRAAGERLADAIAMGVPLNNEYRVIRPSDGEERWIQAIGDTQFDADHTPVRMAGICLDVTDRKRAELALEATDRLVVESQRAAGIGSYRCDFVADRWVSSQVLDEIFGIDDAFDRSVSGWSDIIHPDDRATTAAYLLEEVVGKGRPFDREYRIVRPSDGAVRWVHGLGEVTLGPDGAAQQMTGTIQDVTEQHLAAVERERLAAQLNDAQRMEAIGRLAGGVAHDFNNMLGAILGYAELALDRVTPGEELYDDLMEIHQAAARSAELTRQLLAYARRDTATPEVIDLNTAVAAELKMLRRLMGEAVVIEWLPDPGAASVRMDPAQLDRILANLCVNARDAIEHQGRIVIRTGLATVSPSDCATRPDCEPGEYATLIVADTGRGMTPEVLANAFLPFYTTKDTGEGTGLGLAMVHGIVTGAGGFIDVASSPGAGTTFTIHLPAQGAARPTVEQRRGVEQAAASAEILVVEDEPALLALTSRVLRRLGYSVTAVSSPSEAADLLAGGRTRFDLLLTDVVMPGMSGPDLAAFARSCMPGIRCVFMSGYPADRISKSGSLPAGSALIPKPFTVTSLAERVRDALAVDGPVETAAFE
jgi:PAS domain S-box-containing protein